MNAVHGDDEENDMEPNNAILLPGNVFGVDQIQLNYSIPPIDALDEGGKPLELRVFRPPDMRGGILTAPYLERVEELISEADSDEEHDYWLEVRLLFDLANFTDGLAPRERRNITLPFIETTQPFRELAALGGVKDSGLVRLRQLAPKPQGSDAELMDVALYGVQDLGAELVDGRAYHAFRRLLLNEVSEMIQCACEQLAEALHESPLGQDDQDSAGPSLVEAMPRGFSQAVLERRLFEYGPGRTFIRRKLQETVRLERKTVAAFSNFTTEAKREMALGLALIRSQVEGASGQSPAWTAADFPARLTELFPPSTANQLLTKLLLNYVEHFQVPVVPSSSMVDEPVDILIPKRRRTAYAPHVAQHVKQCQELVDAINSDDIIDKWNALGGCIDDLASRVKMAKAVFLEAEKVRESAIAYGFREIYRQLVPRLTKAERRLFILTYFQHPAFGHLIAARNPILLSFVFRTDGEVLLHILHGLILPASSMGESVRLELRALWRSYLAMYEYLAEMVRKWEREDRRRKRQAKSQFADQRAGSHRTSEFPKQQVAHDPRADWSLQKAKVERFVRSVCTRKEADWILMSQEGMLQAEIGESAGVTQQYVQQEIASGMKKLTKQLGPRPEDFFKWDL